MQCPHCSAEMQIGSPHDDSWQCQYECPRCDKIVGVPIYGGDV
jgi:transposase-like protein